MNAPPGSAAIEGVVWSPASVPLMRKLETAVEPSALRTAPQMPSPSPSGCC